MIRKAEKSDLPQLTELFAGLHRHHCEFDPHKHRMPDHKFFENTMEGILADDEKIVLVSCGGDGTDKSKIDAYALFKIINSDGEEKIPRKVCFVDCFAVREGCRRKGIGKRLLNAVCEYGRERGCNALQLGVDADNGGALKFYEKMGLTPRTFIMTKQI